MSELPEKQIKRLRSLLTEAETNRSAATELLTSMLGDGDIITTPSSTVTDSPEGKIIEGVFDGQIMIGPDGKNYPVPANYASKSKLGEGDILKLTIGDNGGGTQGIDDLEARGLSLYPNPTVGMLNLGIEVTEVSVYDMTGREVMRRADTDSVDLTTLPQGVYMLRITLPDVTTTRRVVKQ